MGNHERKICFVIVFLHGLFCVDINRRTSATLVAVGATLFASISQAFLLPNVFSSCCANISLIYALLQLLSFFLFRLRIFIFQLIARPWLLALFFLIITYYLVGFRLIFILFAIDKFCASTDDDNSQPNIQLNSIVNKKFIFL